MVERQWSSWRAASAGAAEPCRGPSRHSPVIHRRLSLPLCRPSSFVAARARGATDRPGSVAGPGRQNRGRCSPTVRINILIDSRQDYRHVAECPPPDGRRNINIYLQADAVLSSPRPAKPIGLQRHALVTCSVPWRPATFEDFLSRCSDHIGAVTQRFVRWEKTTARSTPPVNRLRDNELSSSIGRDAYSSMEKTYFNLVCSFSSQYRSRAKTYTWSGVSQCTLMQYRRSKDVNNIENGAAPWLLVSRQGVDQRDGRGLTSHLCNNKLQHMMRNLHCILYVSLSSSRSKYINIKSYFLATSLDNKE